MSLLTNYLGVECERILSTTPNVWQQRAPVIGKFLAFNQFSTVKIPKLEGIVEVSKTPSGLGIYYTLERPVTGFKIGGDFIPTEDFDTLLVQDGPNKPEMQALSPGGSAIDHTLGAVEHDIVVSLFATAVFGKLVTESARATLDLNL
jgi:hypothetical protein